MKKQAVCQYCGQVFDDKDYEYGRYLSACADHEVKHLDLEPKFKANLEEALKLLDEKYESKSEYKDFEMHVCYEESYYGTDITYSFYLHSNKIEKVYNVSVKIQYANKEHIPTTEELINQMEKYYIANIKKQYTGTVTFEDWCGGNGADDYMLGDRYVRDIFHELKGKKIEIKVLD